MSGDLTARTHFRRRGQKRGFDMNDKRQSLVFQGGEDGGRREMMLHAAENDIGNIEETEGEGRN